MSWFGGDWPGLLDWLQSEWFTESSPAAPEAPTWIPQYSRIDLPAVEEKRERQIEQPTPISLPAAKKKSRGRAVWIWKAPEPATAEELKPPNYLYAVLRRRQRAYLSRLIHQVNETRSELDLPIMRLPRSEIGEPEGTVYRYLPIRELQYRLVRDQLLAELRRLKKKLRLAYRN
jgi:hypothetical protein